MQNQMILTPFFLDEPMPELESLAASDWLINKPILPDGEKQHRLSALHKPLADFTAAIRFKRRPSRQHRRRLLYHHRYAGRLAARRT